MGRDFDRTHVNNIKAKVHDKAQITAWFGQPARVSTVAGALAVVFDQQGMVCESSYSEQDR